MTKAPLRVGLIGVGNYSSSYHVPHLKAREDALIAAAADVAERAEEATAVTGAEAFFSDHREMIDSGQVDAIIVSTPHGLHHEHGMAALRAGLPTMIDKPLTIGSEQAWELVRAAEDADTLLMTALNRHFDPASRYARQAITSGAVGRVQLTTSLQRGFAASRGEGSWLNDPVIGGGMLYGRTCHMADLLPWLNGSPVVEVSAHVEYQEPGVDLLSLVRLTLANGAAAQMVSMAVSERYQDAITVYGSEESVHLERKNAGPWLASRSRGDYPFEPVPDDELPEGSTSTDNFVDAVLGIAEPLATGEDGARSVRVIEAAIESAARGEPVAV